MACYNIGITFFDRTGQYVLSGSHDGSVLVWDTHETPQQSDEGDPYLHPILPYKAHEDTVNGIRYMS